ncbi:hypothetical protein WS68_02945 [Burkholderia sp. TSV86]|nr:hypothetical protein WS68_02945 [Burkholderia sp. TSV86]
MPKLEQWLTASAAAMSMRNAFHLLGNGGFRTTGAVRANRQCTTRAASGLINSRIPVRRHAYRTGK